MIIKSEKPYRINFSEAIEEKALESWTSKNSWLLVTEMSERVTACLGQAWEFSHVIVTIVILL